MELPTHVKNEKLTTAGMDLQEYIKSLNNLLKIEVENLDNNEKKSLITKHLEFYHSNAHILEYNIQIVPFIPGRRSFDEASYPGLGSSEEVALYTLKANDNVNILYRIFHYENPVHDFPENAKLYVTISVLDHQYRPKFTLSDWRNKEVKPTRLGDETEQGSLRGAYSDHVTVSEAYTLSLQVNEIFNQINSYDEVGDFFGFASQFYERIKVQIDLEVEGVKLSSDYHYVELYNEPMFGSLYKRIINDLVAVDVKRQTKESQSSVDVTIDYHPWFPVLCIGTEKANLYMKAIYGDIIEGKRMLTDPGWLLRVGLYLELLTCLGIIEAVREDGYEILTTDERHIFEKSELYKEVRQRINVNAWLKVWSLKNISISGLKTNKEMPVSFTNLLKKKAATLGFLHAHHDDLKHAIYLAGQNIHNSQETWHRVFRDAERAVLKMDQKAFPELGFLGEDLKKFVLWHESGNFFGLNLIPKKFSESFGDQDGLYLSACRDYRSSMNEVAEWGKKNGLMEYTGEECVPSSASILENYLAKNFGRLKALQNQDGYTEGLEVKESNIEKEDFPVEVIISTLKKVSIFKALFEDELSELARRARPIELGHLERIIVQGREGSSLFVLHDGNLEVVSRVGGEDQVLAHLQSGAVVGEFSFLTGEKRTAAVRAIDQALVIEVSAANLKPLIQKRPFIMNELSRIMEERRQANEHRPEDVSLLNKIAETFFGK